MLNFEKGLDIDTIKLKYTDIFDNNKEKEFKISKKSIKDDFKEKSLFALIVDGKSMQPIIQDKEVIVVDLSQKTLINGKIYIVYYEKKMWVKKYDKENKTFLSINPDYSHLIYKEKDIHLVGKVLDISR